MTDAHIGLIGLAVVWVFGIAGWALLMGTDGCQEHADDDDSVMEE